MATLCLSATLSCSRNAITFEYERSPTYRFSDAERHIIESIAEQAADDVRRLLPDLAGHLRLRVRAGIDVLPETGAMGSALSPDYVSWTVDPHRPGGVAAIAKKELRATLFHEFHHLVRGMTIPTGTRLDRAIAEGMATAFERADDGKTGPWGDYPADVPIWARQFAALSDDAQYDEWARTHPDGLFKVGTYLVDRACAATGETPAALVSVPTANIIAMASKASSP